MEQKIEPEKLTDFPELDAVLYDIDAREKTILGENFVGMYLIGSLAIGDFDWTSDIDFMIITNCELSPDEVAKVQKLHDEFYATNRWTKRLEYSFFPLDKLREWRPGDFMYDKNGTPNTDKNRELWYFNNGHTKIEKSDSKNILIERWTLREKSIAIGNAPDLRQLIPEISPENLRTEIRNIAHGWGAEILRDPTPYRNRFYQSYLVLNYSRMLHDFLAGSVNSKKVGADWARRNLNPKWRSLIDFCWQDRKDENIHISQPASDEIFPQVLEFVREILARI
jgi:predicted nucleotidyltransferase